MAAANQEWDKRRKTKLLKEVGIHVKALRKKKGLSGAELARQLNMERSHVSRLEAGGTNPTVFLIFKICEVLEMTPGEFWASFKEKSK